MAAERPCGPHGPLSPVLLMMLSVNTAQVHTTRKAVHRFCNSNVKLILKRVNTFHLWTALSSWPAAAPSSSLGPSSALANFSKPKYAESFPKVWQMWERKTQATSQQKKLGYLTPLGGYQALQTQRPLIASASKFKNKQDDVSSGISQN